MKPLWLCGVSAGCQDSCAPRCSARVLGESCTRWLSPASFGPCHSLCANTESSVLISSRSMSRRQLDVLRGIEDQDWHKIQQVIVETHNFDNRVEMTTELLLRRGLTEVVVEQLPISKNTNIYTIFATRRR